MYVGRFAPSPSGPLHFGSLVAAAASWLDARAARGRWLLRIEDLDAPRTHPGAADDILRTLERFGFTWDGPVLYQSLRTARYEAALQKLQASTYWCGCTRREIADSALGLAADGARSIPVPAGPACAGARRAGAAPRRRRHTVSFVDRVQGPARRIWRGKSETSFCIARTGRSPINSPSWWTTPSRASRRGAGADLARLDRAPDPSAAAARLSATALPPRPGGGKRER
jgi:hypothetical protein